MGQAIIGHWVTDYLMRHMETKCLTSFERWLRKLITLADFKCSAHLPEVLGLVLELIWLKKLKWITQRPQWLMFQCGPIAQEKSFYRTITQYLLSLDLMNIQTLSLTFSTMMWLTFAQRAKTLRILLIKNWIRWSQNIFCLSFIHVQIQLWNFL